MDPGAVIFYIILGLLFVFIILAAAWWATRSSTPLNSTDLDTLRNLCQRLSS